MNLRLDGELDEIPDTVSCSDEAIRGMNKKIKRGESASELARRKYRQVTTTLEEDTAITSAQLTRRQHRERVVAFVTFIADKTSAISPPSRFGVPRFLLTLERAPC